MIVSESERLQVDIPGTDYLLPHSLDEAVEMAAAGTHTVLAGGTDFYPSRVARPLTEPVLDLSGVAELRGISRDPAQYRIGAMTRWSDVIRAELPPAFSGLQAAAATVGSVQVQNLGTVGGNLCNASPAADGVPPLLTLDAAVELTSTRGVRTLPLGDFILGNRETARAADEVLTAVLVPRTAENAAATFLKLGSRDYLVISIVMVAAVIAATDGTVGDARVAVGACSPVARRLPELEAALVGRDLDADLAAVVSPGHLEGLSPIDDVRGTAAYRQDAALTMVRRAVTECAGHP